MEEKEFFPRFLKYSEFFTKQIVRTCYTHLRKLFRASFAWGRRKRYEKKPNDFEV